MALTAAEVAEVEQALGLSGLGVNLPSLVAPAPRRAVKKVVISMDELAALREAGVDLTGMYVRLAKDEVSGLVEASKSNKWLMQGWSSA